MRKHITIYIAISMAVSLGVGYGAGHYVASNKAERDIAAIRSILEQQEAEKAAKEATNKKIMEDYRKEVEERHKRWDNTPSKSY